MSRYRFFLSLSLLFIFSNCSTSKTIICPDGRPVYRSEENPFDLYNKEIAKNLELKFKIQELLDVNPIARELKEKYEQNIEKLNQESARYWITVIALYESANNDPCNRKLAEEYTNAIKEMYRISILKEKSVENILKLIKQSGVGGNNFEILNAELTNLWKLYSK